MLRIIVFIGIFQTFQFFSISQAGTEYIHSDIYMINVGINTYSSANSHYPNLNGCVNDATLLNTIFGSFDSTTYKKLLLNSEASLDSIYSAFNYVIQNSGPNDVFIFTFSGHGFFENDKFSLLLPDFDVRDSMNRDKHEIRSELLKVWLNKISARRQIILLDNSNSPAAIYKFIGDIIKENQELSEFQKSIAIFSVASNATEMKGDNQESFGQLSYYFTKGLSGSADNNKSGEITCNELSNFIINESYSRGNKITPVYTNSGPDFIIRTLPVSPVTRKQYSNNFLTITIEGNPDILNGNIIDQELPVQGSIIVHKNLYDSVFQADSTITNLEMKIGDKEMIFNLSDLKKDGNDKIFSVKSAKIQRMKITRGIGNIEYTNDLEKRKGTDFGLLIGIENFDYWKKLYNPIYDIETIGNELEKNYSFSLQINKDLTKKQFLSLLQEYFNKKFSDDDQLFIYIASHGDYKEGFCKEGFLVFKDSKTMEEDEYNQTCLSHTNLVDYIGNIPCKHIFLVVDACYAGALDICNSVNRSGDEHKDKDKNQFIRDKLEHKTRLFLASSRKTEVSDGTKGQHSPFAFRFIESLKSRGGSYGVLTIGAIKENIDKIQGEPVLCSMKRDEPGSDFLFITNE